MIEKRFRWRLKSYCDPLTEVSLKLRKFVAGSPEESDAWARLQGELYGLAKCQAYYPLLIHYCPSYRRVLHPWSTNGREISFLVCTEQANILTNPAGPTGRPASTPTTRILFMRKKHEICSDVQATIGEVFDWTNSGTSDCEISHCDPPLELNHYHVRAGQTVQAKVRQDAAKKEYHYLCKRGAIETNPKIIVG